MKFLYFFLVGGIVWSRRLFVILIKTFIGSVLSHETKPYGLLVITTNNCNNNSIMRINSIFLLLATSSNSEAENQSKFGGYYFEIYFECTLEPHR